MKIENGERDLSRSLFDAEWKVRRREERMISGTRQFALTKKLISCINRDRRLFQAIGIDDYLTISHLEEKMSNLRNNLH